jgi:enamine deaminase RidA (YjgF/YER057c/UK114 family)
MTQADGSSPEARLAALGLELPELPAPRGQYVRARSAGGLLFLAGHGPAPDESGARPSGRVGAELTVAEGRAAARRCGLGLLSTLKAELGDLARVESVVRLLVFVRCGPDFVDTPSIADGCSDLMLEVFGPDIGRHARAAVGVEMLPFEMPVEVEAIVAAR